MKKVNLISSVFIFLLSIILLSSNSMFSQVNVDTLSHQNRHLNHKEYRLADKKGLNDLEMIVLLNKGFTYKQIKENPTEELKKTVNLKRVNLQNAYKERYKQLVELEEKVKNQELYIKTLEEKVKSLENRINELEEDN